MKPAFITFRPGLGLGVLIALALPAGAAQAQDTFTVNGPTFVTNGGPLAIVDGDDTLIVTAPAGSITVAGGQSAIRGNGNNNTIIVEAGGPLPALRADGDGADGIAVGGLNTQVIVGGRIEVSGNSLVADTANGIIVEGGGSTIELQGSGVIIATGSGARGIGLFADDGSVTSDGFIDLIGGNNYGIIARGDRVTVLNSGSIGIVGVVPNSIGIDLASEDGLVINTGGITNSGGGGPDNAIGIDASRDRVRVENFGTIAQSGDSSRGIRLTADNGSVFSAGTITLGGTASRGIEVTGTGNTVTHTGTIDTTSFVPGADTDAIGILVIGTNNSVSATGNAEIITTGDNALGISVGLDGNAVLFDGLLISTAGNGAHGIVGGFGDGIVIQTGATNGAEIVTQGTDAHGIYLMATADMGTILNSANIFTNGARSAGIRNDGDNARITNSGEITTSGLDAHGVWNEAAAGSQIENSGFIEVSGQTAYGLYAADSSGAVLINSGEILATGDFGYGIMTFSGSNLSVINSGLIRAEGAAEGGIIAITDATTVLNSGEIRTDPGIVGIIALRDDVFVRNTGRIFSGLGAGDLSFSSDALNTHLRLDPGSIIVGEFEFIVGGATLDVGLPNAAMTWDAAAAPDIILSDGRPQLVVANTLYVFDPDHFAALDRSAFGTIDRIGFTLDQRRAAGGAEGRSVWATGTIASADDTDTLSGMLGGTFALSADRRIGGFVGTQDTEYETPFSSSQIDSRATFGGLTWGGTTDYGFFETALSFGTVSSTSTRRVANNTVPTGIENAVSSLDSRFFSLSATFGTETRFNEIDLRPSLRLRYSWVQSDAFAETGSQADLTVEERSAQRLDLRAKVETDLAPRRTALGPMAVTLYGGLDLAYTDADDVRAVAAGQPVVFGTGQSGTSLQGFIGGHATIATRNGASLSLSGELAAGGTSPELRLGMMYSMRF